MAQILARPRREEHPMEVGKFNPIQYKFSTCQIFFTRAATWRIHRERSACQPLWSILTFALIAYIADSMPEMFKTIMKSRVFASHCYSPTRFLANEIVLATDLQQKNSSCGIAAVSEPKHNRIESWSSSWPRRSLMRDSCGVAECAGLLQH
jgi:hypothetical protein